MTLTAVPDAGQNFLGWAGACSGTGNCVVQLDQNKSVTATFSNPLAIEKTLVIAKAGLGDGTVVSSPAGVSCGLDCSESYPVGNTVTLTATPNGSSIFAGWSGEGCSGTGNCVVVVGSDAVITATFDLVPPSLYPLSVTMDGTGSGMVSSVPDGISCGTDCGESYTDGTSVTLTATPESHSEFKGWTGVCSGTGDCVVSMTAARTVKATFDKKTFLVQVTRSGLGTGLVNSTPGGINCGADCEESFTIDSSVTLRAVPTGGSEFAGWTGACSGTGDCDLLVNEAKTVDAEFIPKPMLTVSKTGAGQGTVTSIPGGINCGLDCEESYSTGKSVELTATPDLGNRFVGWSGDCTGTGSCVVSMTAAKNVTAEFAKDYTGTWSGTTSQAYPMSFDVDKELIKTLKFKMYYPFCGTAETTITYISPFTISGDSFTSTSFKGSFSTLTNAAGTISDSVGYPCYVSNTVTWDATRSLGSSSFAARVSKVDSLKAPTETKEWIDSNGNQVSVTFWKE